MSDFPDMTGAFEIDAPAKTNLWLRVLGKREDGFHEIDTRMVCLSLRDTLFLKWRDDEKVVLRCSDPCLPTGEENLVVRAVRALERHCQKKFALSIDLEKSIPSGAGLGGGSSDAAAVLRAINQMAELNLSEEVLSGIAATIGSDIPFFVYDRPCDCRGRGELVTPVKGNQQPKRLGIFLCKPPFEISAGWAYQRFAESAEYKGFHYLPQVCAWGEMVNHLERPVFEKFPILGDMKKWLLEQPEIHAALLSGSGSTMLAMLKNGASGESLGEKVKARYGETCWTYVGTTV